MNGIDACGGGSSFFSNTEKLGHIKAKQNIEDWVENCLRSGGGA